MAASAGQPFAQADPPKAGRSRPQCHSAFRSQPSSVRLPQTLGVAKPALPFHPQTMKYLQIIIGLLFLVALLAFIYTHRRKGSSNRPVRRLPANQTSRAATSATSGQCTAAELLTLVAKLRAQKAQWPEILRTLNPSSDASANEILLAIRGPHMFDPHTGLGVLETGFRSVAPSTPLVTALTAARKSMESVVGFGR